MTFDDIPLFDAIYQLRHEMEEGEENPGSDIWTSDESKRVELTKRILGKLIDSTDQRLVDAWICFRKSSDVNGRKKIDLLIEVTRAHGNICFYRNRGLGECSQDIDLDRIVPGSRGGVYSVENCVISCSRHNRMRGDKSLEDMLSNGQRENKD